MLHRILPEYKNKPRPWSKEEDDTLKRLIAEKLPFSKIGGIMGRNKNSVIGRAHRIGASGGANIKTYVRPKPDPKPAPAPKEEEPVKSVAPALSVVPQTPIAEKGPAVTEDIAIPVSQRVQLMALRPNSCRWPAGDPREETFGFCGKPRRGLSPYCEEHHEMSYVAIKLKPRKYAIR